MSRALEKTETKCAESRDSPTFQNVFLLEFWRQLCSQSITAVQIIRDGLHLDRYRSELHGFE
jgi:hypothetical protein